MSEIRVQFRRAESAVILTVAGALLLLSVATSEARAATVTPVPSGGEDADGIDGFTFVGAAPTCSGLYGVGKVVIDLGVPAEIEDPEDASATIVNPAFAAALMSASTDSLFLFDATPSPVKGSETSVFLNSVIMCAHDVGPDDLDDFATFDAPFEVALDIDTGDVACSGDLHMGVWFTPDTFEDGPGSGEALVQASGRTWAYFMVGDEEGDALDTTLELTAAAALADVLDCTRSTSTAPVSRLALACEPTVVSVGQRVTCQVTGGDPNVTILWSASASPAFAGQGVTLGADGRGSFSFVVPASALGRAVTVELEGWGRSTLVQVAGTAIVPSSVPAGEGSGPQRGLLLAGVALLSAALVRSRRGRGVLEHTG
jgi:hypothetical protein